ncbi:MAG: hypothetical protein GOMPHAMPRED_001337 [Gomphillus americanus]|uniref:Myb-like domain-containing protein n=1 Tax=Gomphillus americanus TaxID=1940652 RepID=A0A8H3F8T8_9LECA|nr:MAG: hypothetical protein GOMPHAMPRED_001337 [Gomphillus americanus]
MAFVVTPAEAITEVPAGPEPTRKPGNLWTAEAREDMFSRRESGEGWETICQDYPNRSRHAMQQQYSMMKKQRALENGTWAMNRRGRKRRIISPERRGGDGEMSEDDFSDDLPERGHTTRLPPFSTMIGTNPASRLRTTTDPLFARHLPAIGIPPTGSTRDGSSSLSPILFSNSPDHKRPRFAGHQPTSIHLHKAYDQWHPKLPDLAFTEADVATLVQKGRDQAARIIEDVNHRNELIRKGKDNQITRYLTQLREAQDQLAIEKGQGPYAQELNRRDREIDSLREKLAALQEALNARNGRCMYLENENAEIKTRIVDLGKGENNGVSTNSPPSTPLTCRTFSQGFALWQNAMDELSKDIDGIWGYIKAIRTSLDRASISQVASSVDELDLAMSLMVRNRDGALSAFSKLQGRAGEPSTLDRS